MQKSSKGGGAFGHEELDRKNNMALYSLGTALFLL